MWLSLDDHPPVSQTPLELAIRRLVLEGRARQLIAALHLPDPDGLSHRLLGQRGGQLLIHARHLEALTVPLSPPQAGAFRVALGLALPDDLPDEPAPRPRLELLIPRGPAEGPALPYPADPAHRLTRAMRRLAASPDALSPYNAALATQALRGVAWHWLDLRSALHLELLGGVGETQGPGLSAAQAAEQQVQTTLGGGRRSAARLLIAQARQQHQALNRYLADLRVARTELIRAAVEAAATLCRQGHLNGVAQARWLSPAELRDALDGTVDPSTLRGLIQLRRLQHVQAPGVATWTLVDRAYSGLPLATGVRDGLVHLWQPGRAVPEGRIALCTDLSAWHWPELAPALALLLDRSGELSAPAMRARALGLPALSLRGRRPEWLQEGAYVRVNAHQGTLTLLHRAEPVSLASGPSAVEPTRDTAPLYSLAADPVLSQLPLDLGPGRVPPAGDLGELRGLSLDFDFPA